LFVPDHRIEIDLDDLAARCVRSRKPGPRVAIDVLEFLQHFEIPRRVGDARIGQLAVKICFSDLRQAEFDSGADELAAADAGSSGRFVCALERCGGKFDQHTFFLRFVRDAAARCGGNGFAGGGGGELS
jgi:hypothetical protein